MESNKAIRDTKWEAPVLLSSETLSLRRKNLKLGPLRGCVVKSSLELNLEKTKSPRILKSHAEEQKIILNFVFFCFAESIAHFVIYITVHPEHISINKQLYSTSIELQIHLCKTSLVADVNL